MNSFEYRAITYYGQPFQIVFLEDHASHNGLFRIRSPLLTESLFDFFSSGYLDVSVLRVRSLGLCIQPRVTNKLVGFPHSDISGSKLVVNSPELFADYYVLHRLLLPRHPPYALINLTI